MAHYRVTPLEKKSIEVFYELFREDPDTGVVQWMNISELFRWGQAFIEDDKDANLPYDDDDAVYCFSDQGEFEGCEFEDSISVNFEFDETITEEEQEEIKNNYYENGAGWVFEGDHNWQIEDDYVSVYSPFKIEYCEPDGTVIKEIIPEPRK